MKIHLFILGLFVVATLAHIDESENRTNRRRHFIERRPNDNREDDTDLGNSISSGAKDEQDERIGRHSRMPNGSGRRFGHNFEHNPEWHQRQRIPMPDEHSEGGTRHRFHNHNFIHSPEWHKRHEIPMPDENSEGEKGHGRVPSISTVPIQTDRFATPRSRVTTPRITDEPWAPRCTTPRPSVEPWRPRITTPRTTHETWTPRVTTPIFTGETWTTRVTTPRITDEPWTTRVTTPRITDEPWTPTVTTPIFTGETWTTRVTTPRITDEPWTPRVSTPTIGEDWTRTLITRRIATTTEEPEHSREIYDTRRIQTEYDDAEMINMP